MAGLNRIYIALCATISFSAAAAQTTAPTGGVHVSVLKLISPDAAAALVIPSLKACSDELTQCLEGMERDQFLLGSRPLDQLKSMSGFNIGVDDLGGLALVMMERDKAMSSLVLVPVTDAKAFLAGNFATHEGDRHTRPDGLSVTARDLGSHVLLSTDEAAAREYQPQGGLTDVIRNELAASDQLIITGELFVFARRNAIAMLSDRMREGAMAMGANDVPQPPLARSALVVVDVDPLAVIIRGLARFEDGVVEANEPPASPSSVTMNAMPDKPFYAAISANSAGVNAVRSLMPNASTQDWPAWFLQAKSIHFAAFPSPAGLAGGLLNDSALVVNSNDAGATLAAIKADMLAAAADGSTVKRDVKWEDARPVKDVGTAAAFEIRMLDIPPAMAQQQLVEQLIFGRSGIRGYLTSTNDSVIMTFSQRPAVLAAALAVLAAPEQSLEASPVIATMRRWMPSHRDLEGYLGVVQLVEMGRQVMQSFGLADGPIPAVDANAPPIGFAMNVDRSTIESSLVLPGPIVAMMFDEALCQFSAAARTPGKVPADDAGEPKDQQ